MSVREYQLSLVSVAASHRLETHKDKLVLNLRLELYLWRVNIFLFGTLILARSVSVFFERGVSSRR